MVQNAKGQCVNPPAGATSSACPTGQVANGTGGCVGTPTGACPTGQTMQNGVCVKPMAGGSRREHYQDAPSGRFERALAGLPQSSRPSLAGS
jgi:hypothetical protein